VCAAAAANAVANADAGADGGARPRDRAESTHQRQASSPLAHPPSPTPPHTHTHTPHNPQPTTTTTKTTPKVEGACNGKYGYVVSVVAVHDVGRGKLRDDGSGLATFRVEYQALTVRPFRGEVVDAVVTSVNKMGFFAEAGPLQLFCSSHLVPEDLEFSAAGDAAFVSADGATRVEPDSEVRLRIVGVRTDASEIFAIATMKDDFLGVLS
jgi:DNA-directed RNA polymerase II subunit RPB7